MATLGKTSIGATLGNPYTMETLGAIGPFTATENGTITSVSIWTQDFVNVTFGVYNSAAGVPTSLVGDSAGGLAAINDWTTQAVSGALVSGQVYWVVFNTASGNQFKYDAGTFRIKGKASAYVSGTLPDPFGTEDFDVPSRDYSAYITYTPSGGGVSWLPQTGIAQGPVRRTAIVGMIPPSTRE